MLWYYRFRALQNNAIRPNFCELTSIYYNGLVCLYMDCVHCITYYSGRYIRSAYTTGMHCTERGLLFIENCTVRHIISNLLLPVVCVRHKQTASKLMFRLISMQQARLLNGIVPLHLRSGE